MVQEAGGLAPVTMRAREADHRYAGAKRVYHRLWPRHRQGQERDVSLLEEFVRKLLGHDVHPVSDAEIAEQFDQPVQVVAGAEMLVLENQLGVGNTVKDARPTLDRGDVELHQIGVGRERDLGVVGLGDWHRQVVHCRDENASQRQMGQFLGHVARHGRIRVQIAVRDHEIHVPEARPERRPRPYRLTGRHAGAEGDQKIRIVEPAEVDENVDLLGRNDGAERDRIHLGDVVPAAYALLEDDVLGVAERAETESRRLITLRVVIHQNLCERQTARRISLPADDVADGQPLLRLGFRERGLAVVRHRKPFTPLAKRVGRFLGARVRIEMSVDHGHRMRARVVRRHRHRPAMTRLALVEPSERGERVPQLAGDVGIVGERVPGGAQGFDAASRLPLGANGHGESHMRVLLLGVESEMLAEPVFGLGPRLALDGVKTEMDQGPLGDVLKNLGELGKGFRNHSAEIGHLGQCGHQFRVIGAAVDVARQGVND